MDTKGCRAGVLLIYIYVFTEVTSWKVIHLVSYGPYFIIIIIINL